MKQLEPHLGQSSGDFTVLASGDKNKNLLLLNFSNPYFNVQYEKGTFCLFTIFYSLIRKMKSTSMAILIN